MYPPATRHPPPATFRLLPFPERSRFPRQPIFFSVPAGVFAYSADRALPGLPPAPAGCAPRTPVLLLTTDMTSAEIRQSFLDFFREKEHAIVPLRQPAALLAQSPFHQRGHEPVRALLPGCRAASLPSRPRRRHAEVHSRRRQAQRPRRRGLGHVPPHVLRDARQLVFRRLLQGRGHRLGLGTPRRTLEVPRPAVSTPPSTGPARAIRASSTRKPTTTGRTGSPRPGWTRRSTSSTAARRTTSG